MNSIDAKTAENIKTALGVRAAAEPTIATLTRALINADGVSVMKTSTDGSILVDAGVIDTGQLRIHSGGGGNVGFYNGGPGNSQVFFDIDYINGVQYATASSGGRLISFSGQFLFYGYSGATIGDNTAGGSALWQIAQDTGNIAEYGHRAESVQQVSTDNGALTAASTNVSVTRYGVDGAATTTLGSGTVEGQIKRIYLVVQSVGSLVVTVTNAAWNAGASGTATFNAAGDSLSLQWLNGKWHVISNNSVTLA